MKRVKIGFTAIIAILAMSFTIASRDGAFNKKIWNSRYAYTCVSGTDVIGFGFCIGFVASTVDGSTSAANVPAQGNCSFSVTYGGIGHTCDETQKFFCCYERSGICTPGSCTLSSSGVTIGQIHYNSHAQ